MAEIRLIRHQAGKLTQASGNARLPQSRTRVTRGEFAQQNENGRFVNRIVRPDVSQDWAGSLPLFPRSVGRELAQSCEFDDFRVKRLLFGRLETPDAIHVYSANCGAGERLRVQMVTPSLSLGTGVAPAFAVVAQSLPYSADVHKLPFDLPAGYSAVVAPPPTELAALLQDRLTGANYFPGPVVDTRTLVSGRCYVVVWSPRNDMGKYVLQIGHSWPLSSLYWLRLPMFWWQIRGWYGLSRAAAYAGGAGVLGTVALVWALLRRR